MIKYFRTALTVALLAGAAVPALAQTAAAPAAQPDATAAAPDATAPAPDAAPMKTVKHTHHARHHHVAAAKKTVPDSAGS